MNIPPYDCEFFASDYSENPSSLALVDPIVFSVSNCVDDDTPL